ncbi:ThuA domain-containing protein [Cohnella sp.]|uniref:ThuA domain-containing protein n=1 Tax=Cohnella sp. TaxID=1883426 RepID=UPI003561A7AD
MKQIVAIVGDFYHVAEDSAEALNQALKPMIDSGELSLRYISVEQLKSALAEGPDAVILFAEDRISPEADNNARWMSDEISVSIAKYVEAGGGWLAWHSGLASYDKEGSYVSMLRGCFLHHPELHQPVTYTFTAQDQTTFEIMDEHYFVACSEEQTEVFLRSESVDGSSIAGWRHPYGGGRVCCLTPAHRRDGLLHTEVLKLLQHSVGWCCGGLK